MHAHVRTLQYLKSCTKSLAFSMVMLEVGADGTMMIGTRDSIGRPHTYLSMG